MRVAAGCAQCSTYVPLIGTFYSEKYLMHAERPSKTAYKVALNILTLGAKPGMAEILPTGIVDATAKLLIACGVAGTRTVRWYRSTGMVHVYEAFDWMMPGQFEAFAHRKAFCERQVRECIAAGATQVLVLGAGYDTIGWRLAPEFPNVDFLEIDLSTACLARVSHDTR